MKKKEKRLLIIQLRKAAAEMRRFIDNDFLFKIAEDDAKEAALDLWPPVEVKAKPLVWACNQESSEPTSLTSGPYFITGSDNSWKSEFKTYRGSFYESHFSKKEAMDSCEHHHQDRFLMDLASS